MDRNKILIGVSGILLVGAVVVYYTLSGEEKEAVPDDVATTMTKIVCESCGQSYEIPFEQAQEFATDAAAQGKKFKCDKCGQATAWIKPSMDMGNLPTPTQEQIDQSIGNPPTRIDEGTAQGDAPPEEKLVPAAAPMFDPNAGKGGG